MTRGQSFVLETVVVLNVRFFRTEGYDIAVFLILFKKNARRAARGWHWPAASRLDLHQVTAIG
jgi:hypothetical protein